MDLFSFVTLELAFLLYFPCLWYVWRVQDRILDLEARDTLRQRPIYRLAEYGRGLSVWDQELSDKEIERRIRERFARADFEYKRKNWNPRYTKPHHPWETGNTKPPMEI